MTNISFMNRVDLETSVNHHIALSATMIKRVFFKILSENQLDITPEQWSVLYYLSESDSYTAKELSELTFKDFANVSRMIQKLEAAGLIDKRKDAIDKRVSKLFITDAGRELIKQIHQCAFESTNIAMEGIEEETKDVILKGLKQVISNTSDYLK